MGVPSVMDSPRKYSCGALSWVRLCLVAGLVGEMGLLLWSLGPQKSSLREFGPEVGGGV